MSFIVVGPPYTLRLKVKFYSSEPNTLREELTRYQFFLQLKQDLLDGRLHSKTTDHNPNVTSFEEKCAELCALSLQCECFFLLIEIKKGMKEEKKKKQESNL